MPTLDLGRIQGRDGKSPYVGENGNWYAWDDAIGDYTDTGTKAQGQDGEPGAPGKDGADGADGKDGITPTIGSNGNWYLGETDTGKPSRGEKGDKGDTGAAGAAGAKGDKGDSGVSCTHSWNGTTLTVTSASGTSSANLKGDKGDTGATGAQGAKGDKGDKGDTGAAGAKGKDATINGVNALTIVAGNGISITQNGTTLTISLQKQDPELTLSAYSVSKLPVSLASAPSTITVSRKGNGVISAVSANTSLATVSVSDTTVEITHQKIGDTTVTVSVAETAEYTAAQAEISVNTYAGCFVAGTQVLTSLDGTTQAIESLKAGDGVLSYHVATGENYLALVKKLIINPCATDMVRTTLANGTVLNHTAEHPIFCEGGFHSLTNYKGYETLSVGDRAKTLDGWSEITDIYRYVSEPLTTYTLDIVDVGEDPDDDTEDTFYAEGVVVHNKGTPLSVS